MNDRIYIDSSMPKWKGNMHMHTVRSDGKFQPAELVEAYKQRGYSFIQISDHEVYWNSTEFDSADFLLLGGTESSVRMNREHIWLLDYRSGFSHRNMHFGCIMDETEPPQKPYFAHNELVPRALDRGLDSWNNSVARLKEHGNLVIINHPDWSRLEMELLLATQGCFAMEIWNSGNALHCGGRDDAYAWDYCLRRGKRLYAVAGDDAHAPGAALGASFTMVQAPELSKAALINAFKSGSFYGSTGPELYDVRVEGGILKLRFSPAKRVTVVAYDGEGNTRTAQEGSYMESYEWPLKESFKYVRAMVSDEHGHTAWTQPIFIEDLLDIDDYIKNPNPLL